MDRRDFMVTGLAASAATLSGLAWAKDEPKKKDSSDPRRAALDKVVVKAFECVERGEKCKEHAVRLFKKKDTSLAECHDLAVNMTIICGAMAKIAAHDSAPKDRMKDMLKVCEKICRDCAVACRPHAKKHAICNACMESCVACEEACKKASDMV